MVVQTVAALKDAHRLVLLFLLCRTHNIHTFYTLSSVPWAFCWPSLIVDTLISFDDSIIFVSLVFCRSVLIHHRIEVALLTEFGKALNLCIGPYWTVGENVHRTE